MTSLARPVAVAAIPLVAAALIAACAGRSNPGASAFVPAPPAVAKVAAKSPIEINGPGKNTALDGLVVGFMVAQQVPNAQLAVSVKGKTTFSHAYTYHGLAASTT